jgi:hypothetical protein
MIKINAGFGFGSRSEKKLPDPRSESPSVGLYNPDDLDNKLKHAGKGGYSPGKSKKLYNHNYEKHTSSVPGPGAYESLSFRPKGPALISSS